jgi:hypothetical protein
MVEIIVLLSFNTIPGSRFQFLPCIEKRIFLRSQQDFFAGCWGYPGMAHVLAVNKAPNPNPSLVIPELYVPLQLQTYASVVIGIAAS